MTNTPTRHVLTETPFPVPDLAMSAFFETQEIDRNLDAWLLVLDERSKGFGISWLMFTRNRIMPVIMQTMRGSTAHTPASVNPPRWSFGTADECRVAWNNWIRDGAICVAWCDVGQSS